MIVARKYWPCLTRCAFISATITVPEDGKARGSSRWGKKATNIHVGGGRTRDEFIAFRTERDAQLAMPKLIIPSLQVNMRAGELPRDEIGNALLKVP